MSAGVERLQAGGAADDEGQQAEVLVLLGVDGAAGAGRGPVVAEHADEGRGALGRGQGDAGAGEGGEGGGGHFERAGDGGGDVVEEGAREVPGGAEGRFQAGRAVGGGFDRQDGLFAGDVRVAFLARGGAAGGLVVRLFGGVRGEVEEFAGLGEELGVCFYHSGAVG